jgi:hypothetical protein
VKSPPSAFPVPPLSEGFYGPRARAPVPLRFEDVTQDGRLVLEALPNALGATIWRGLLLDDPAIAVCLRHGIIPMLARLVLAGTAGPFSADGAVEAEGTYRVARSEEGHYVLDLRADLFAPIGRTYGRPGADAERVLAGSVLAEQIFTRPSDPPGRRKVTAFDFEGVPEVLQTRPASPSADAIAAIPEGATPLEPAMRLDAAPVTFGLVHTDSNMHVNSLAYLRAFEEAALRRFLAIGRGTLWLGRSVDIMYRKPCFAGESMRVYQRVFEQGDRLGVVATLVDEAAASSDETAARARPRTFVRMMFER